VEFLWVLAWVAVSVLALAKAWEKVLATRAEK
jgi:hypothetical protein